MREYRLRAMVYYSDTDAGGIAYHRSYLDWAEHGRTEMLRSLLPEATHSNLAEDGLLAVVKSIEIHYRKPAFLDDGIEVVTSVRKVQRYSCILSQRVMRSDELLSDLSVKVAFIDKRTKRPVMIPDAIRSAMEEDDEGLHI